MAEIGRTMGRLEFLVRIAALLVGLGLVGYVLHADKPVSVIAALMPLIMLALAGNWQTLSSTTTNINEAGDPGEGE